MRLKTLIVFIWLTANVLPAAELIPFGSSWRYVLGTQEASSPASAWRAVGFSDGAWLTASTPIGYGEVDIITTIRRTDSAPTFSSVFLRKTFTVSNPSDVTSLDLAIRVDDGFIAWINGTEVGRFNMPGSPGSEPVFSDTASAAGEPALSTITLSANLGTLLVSGNNVVAVQMFQSPDLASSDLLFDASLSVAMDDVAPVVVDYAPPTGGTVTELAFIGITFSESVTGVDAADLRINGNSATGLTSPSPREYQFTFPAPPTGLVQVAWAPGHGIRDLATSPNAFAGGSWTYMLDPNAMPPVMVISEFMADNENGIRDDDGTRSDWIELYNAGSVDVNLAGWFLTDETTNRTKWRFPSVSLGANRYLLVWASEKNKTNPAAALHTNFRLEKNGEYLALVDAQTNVVSEFDPAYPAQESNISYGRDRVDPNLVGYFVTPTPGAQNATSGAGFAPVPMLSLESGVYTNTSLSLVITVPLNTTVRYTTNGTVPTNTSAAYTAPITLQNNTTIKARAFPSAAGLFPSPVEVRHFLFLDSTTRDFNSNIPILVLSTEGRSIASSVPPGGQRTRGTFTVFDTFRGRSALSRQPDYMGPMGIEVTGQTSAGFAKVPYRIELQDGLENDKDVAVLGLPEEADWQLRNPFSDKCLMNDFLAYELFEQMGNYSCRRRFVEVFVDSGANRLSYPGDYIGVEVLFERIERGNDRVDIEELTPSHTREPEISGGFIFKKDKDSGGDLNFSAGGQGLKLHEPRPNTVRVAQGVTTTWPGSGYTPSGSNQMTYLVNYLNAFNNSMNAVDWLTRTGTNHYSHYIDLAAFVDQHWIVEFTKQIDGYRLSDFFSKDRNGKVRPVPIWDWNLSFGNADYLDGGNTNTWYYALIGAAEHIWLRRLIGAAPLPNSGGDPDFIQRVIDRWGQLRTNVMNGDRVLARIDEIAGILTDKAAPQSPATRNFAKHPNLNTYLWPNPQGPPSWHVDYTQTNYSQIISEMKKWTRGRYLWIDNQLPKAPILGIPEGDVAPGTPLVLNAPAGTIYYTLNGTDPRASQNNGAVAPGALTYSGTVALNNNARVFARARVGTSATWSPPVIATYVVSRPRLIVSEIMYHPLGPPPGNTNDQDNFEYIEIKNVGATTLSLNGVRFINGIDFDFTGSAVTSLGAGQRALVVRHPAAFASRYGAVANIAGSYTNNLANDGERITLVGPVLETILDFEYQDDWHPITDGNGFSLVAVDENAPLSAWSTQAQWRPSGQAGGSPGQNDPAPPAIPGIVVNEALTHTDPPNQDTVELRNPTGGAVNVGGWFLTDDFNVPKKYRILDNTMIPGGGYALFTDTQYNLNNFAGIPFSLSELGDAIYLFSADGGGNLTGYSHGFDFGASQNGVAFGRHVVNSTGEDHFVAQTDNSLGAANAGPKTGPIVISEIMYRPPDVFTNSAFWNNSEDEFVELRNITAGAVPLYDPLRRANTWGLRDAISFSFPSNVTMAAGSFLLVVSFDPIKAPSELARFRAKYGLSPSVPIYGPYDRELANNSDSVELVMPGEPEVGLVPEILVDKVRYSDVSPWPVAADGIGPSLQRVNAGAYGNDPANWVAASRTPGAGYGGGAIPVILQQPMNATAVAFNDATFSVMASGALSYQWRFNGGIIPGGTNSILRLTNLQPGQAGLYDVVVLNAANAISSSNALLTVLMPATITFQPANVRARPGATAGFSVTAVSSTPISYQWQFNGQDIPGATSSTFTINNVEESDHGEYRVRVTDSVGSVLSAPATLIVLVDPEVVEPVPYLTLNVAQGQTVTFSTRVIGTLPIGYRWRRGGSTLTNAYPVQSHTHFMTLRNIQTGNTNITLVLTNIANTPGSGVIRTNAILNVLADTDLDGIPDLFETAHGLDPNNPADANQDADGDGLTNGEEYLAGTDHQDASSVLEIETIAVSPLDGAALLTFLAVAHRTYTIESSGAPTGGPWEKVADVVAAEGDRVVTVVDMSAPANAPLYYRLVTPTTP